MSARVVLRIKSGAIPPKPYVFVGPMRCFIGRSSDCPLQIPAMEVSRHHCLLEVDPPGVRVRDLCSRNGTYVNGVPIGRRDASQEPELAEREPLPAIDLRPGDQLQVGATIFEIDVIVAEPECMVPVVGGEVVMS
jgi:eukaryotic-like serine/threonine-protein kinase